MKRIALVMSLILAVIALNVPAFAAAQQPAGTERIVRMYQPRFLSTGTVVTLAFQVCGDSDQCTMESLGNEGFVMRATAAIHERVSALLNERDLPPTTQDFRIILLRATSGSGNAIPDLPDGAAEAVADLRSVLPYDGFELIDSSWLRTSGEGGTTLGTGGAFQVNLRFVGNPREANELLISDFVLNYRNVTWYGDEGQVTEEVSPARVHLGDTTQLINSQFGMSVGETVVVGTSRMSGRDDALVVLLTALAR